MLLLYSASCSVNLLSTIHRNILMYHSSGITIRIETETTIHMHLRNDRITITIVTADSIAIIGAIMEKDIP